MLIPKLLEFNEDELQAIRSEYAKDATDAQFTNFIAEAKRRNLYPGRQLYFQVRKSSEWDSDTGAFIKTKRAIHLTAIDSFRLNAQRTNEYRGQKPPVYIYLDGEGQPTVRSTVPLPEVGSTTNVAIPWAVEVGVYRDQFEEPIVATARFDAYAVYYKKQNKFVLSSMWEKRAPEMLAKCAEALALRQAFPEELGGLYIEEELKHDEEPQEATDNRSASNPTNEATTAPSLPVQATVNHQPVEGTDNPRPHEKEANNETARENSKKRGRKPRPKDKPSDFEPPETQETAPENEVKLETDLSNELPTKEEKQVYATKLRSFKIESDLLRRFVLNFTQVNDIKNLTKGQFESVIKQLEETSKQGKDALESFLTLKANYDYTR